MSAKQLRLWVDVEPACSLPMRARRPAPRLIVRADDRSLGQLAREALDVQDACNLSGVVHSYARALSRLRALLPDAGTQAINGHPIAQLWADKCAHLTGTQGHGCLSEAYSAVQQLAAGGAARGLFRVLDAEETASFREWARSHHRPGQEISPVWHPVVQEECRAMDREAASS